VRRSRDDPRKSLAEILLLETAVMPSEWAKAIGARPWPARIVAFFWPGPRLGGGGVTPS